MAHTDRAAVRNAADPQQVKDAGRRDKRDVALFDDQLRAVLDTPAGRALLWAILRRSGLYTTVFHRDPGVMAFNAGRQNFGQELLDAVIAADRRLYLLMEREARERDSRDDAAVEAAHTPSADSQERT